MPCLTSEKGTFSEVSRARPSTSSFDLQFLADFSHTGTNT
jgi:hypothetical protein